MYVWCQCTWMQRSVLNGHINQIIHYASASKFDMIFKINLFVFNYCNYLLRAVMEVVKQIFRPWLQIRWLRKLTNYDKKVNYFRKFSDTILDGVINTFYLFLF